jgi:hypothetical protein
VKALSSWAIAAVTALYFFAAAAKAQDSIAPLQLFSLKSGETLPIRVIFYVTPACESLFLAFEGIDILEGPPELSLRFEPGKIYAVTTARSCPTLVDGGTLMATAKPITERIDTPLTFRVRIATQQGPVPFTMRYRVLIFPPGESTTAAKQ